MKLWTLNQDATTGVYHEYATNAKQCPNVQANILSSPEFSLKLIFREFSDTGVN